MNTKTLIILGGVLVASVTAVVIKMSSNADTFTQPSAIVGDMLLKNVSLDNVASISINDGKNSVDLALKDGKWQIPSRDGFPATVTDINMLTDTSFNLKVRDVIADIGKSQYPRLGLADAGEGIKPEETGKVVVFKDSSGKELGKLVVGRTQEKKADAPFSMSGPEPSPQWIRVNAETTIYKTATGFSKLDGQPKAWLDKEKFFKVERHKSIAVTGPTPEESWKVFREAENGEMKLDAPKPGEEFDPSKAASQGSVFNYVSFEDILPAAEKDKAALDKPVYTAVVETFDGLTYTVKVGAKVAADPSATSGSESYYISYSVDGKLDETVPPYAAPQPTAPAAPAADAKDEDKKKYEEAKKAHETAMKTWEDGKKAAETSFQETLKTKKEKLAAEQALQTRIFVVTKSPTLEPIMKKRADFMKDKPAAPPEGANPSGTNPGTPVPPHGTPAPGVKVLPPKVSPLPPKNGAKIEAVTPPIEVTIPGKEPAKEAPKVTPPAPPQPPKADDKAKAADKDKKKLK
ncbi:MAG TPA: hypothetical protein VHM91_06955 [Verrucomicrobiales bacterium]|nr:hypothetical protein [Verrucomicrobiales bacterium]